MHIHADKQNNKTNGNVEDIIKLMGDLLNSGRNLYTGSSYTSVSLAKELLKKKTNLIGTIGKNRKGIPKFVAKTKLNKRQYISRQTSDGITILKWKDVLFISTLHDDSRSEEQKPTVLKDYDKSNNALDQMASYNPFIQRTSKWYRKIFFHIICNLAVINAWCLYKIKHGNNMHIMDFKKSIVRSWLSLQLSVCDTSPNNNNKRILEEVGGPKKSTRRRCRSCYAELSQKFGAKVAVNRTKQVHTRCSKCKSHFCLNCFQTKHKKC